MEKWFIGLVIVVITLKLLHYFIKPSHQHTRHVKRPANQAQWEHLENMPDDIRQSTIYLNEEFINSKAFHGKVDQVFKTTTHQLILVDTKNRKYHAVFKSDIIQLSVYAQILRETVRYTTLDYGYIRTVISAGNREGEVRYIKVDLLTEDCLAEYAAKYRLITKGKVKPICTCGGKIIHA